MAVIAAAAVVTAATGGVGLVGCFAAGALKCAVIGGAIGAAVGGTKAALKHRKKLAVGKVPQQRQEMVQLTALCGEP